MLMSISGPQEPKAGACYLPLRRDRWQPEEDARLIELVENGMSWKNISEDLPGRSELSSVCPTVSHQRAMRPYG